MLTLHVLHEPTKRRESRQAKSAVNGIVSGETLTEAPPPIERPPQNA